MLVRKAAAVGLLSIAFGLSGCVLPPAVTVASFAVDVGSLFATGKTAGDHAISYVVEEDCRIWRGVVEADIDAVCLKGEEIMLAKAEHAKDAGLSASKTEQDLERLPVSSSPQRFSWSALRDTVARFASNWPPAFDASAWKGRSSRPAMNHRHKAT